MAALARHHSGVAIDPDRTLIILDEVQLAKRALNSLKYFAEDAPAPEYHVVAAGSLLGLRLGRAHSFPVGKVTFLDLHPLSFAEFLAASGDERYCEVLSSLSTATPPPLPFHMTLLDRLREYFVVGGMPEAVSRFVSGNAFADVRAAQRAILDAYALDFAKYALPTITPKLSIVWQSIPEHLGRENKKFVFSALWPGARTRGYEDALAWLDDAGIVHIVHRVERPTAPLVGQVRRNAFKIYVLDVGLLSAMVGVPESALLDEKAVFAENFVVQELTQAGFAPLHYWATPKRTAEVDFVVQVEDRVVPLEVKSGINARSKSLRSYADRFAPAQLTRTTPLNLRRDGDIVNYPLYALSRFPEL